MNDVDKLSLKIGCRIDSAKRHIRLAEKRQASPEFILWLRNGLRRYIEAMNALTSKAVPVVVVCVVLALSGCGTMKAISNVGEAAFKDMGLVVEGAQQKMVENYRQ